MRLLREREKRQKGRKMSLFKSKLCNCEHQDVILIYCCMLHIAQKKVIPLASTTWWSDFLKKISKNLKLAKAYLEQKKIKFQFHTILSLLLIVTLRRSMLRYVRRLNAKLFSLLKKNFSYFLCNFVREDELSIEKQNDMEQ